MPRLSTGREWLESADMEHEPAFDADVEVVAVKRNLELGIPENAILCHFFLLSFEFETKKTP